MIACPHCEREFEKRAGLMRHVTVSHPHEPYEEVPVNPGGAIEPVEAETYAESLDELAPGQEPYVDPPTREEYESGVIGVVYGSTAHTIVEPPVHLSMDGPKVDTTLDRPTSEQYKQIRAFIRSGRSEWEAWMNVVGHEPPPRPPQPVDERPLRLQQVAFRVRNGGTDQIDARWLLHLAEIGAEAIGVFEMLRKEADVGPSTDALIERWKEALS